MTTQKIEQKKHYLFKLADDLGRPMTHRKDIWAFALDEAYGKLITEELVDGPSPQLDILSCVIVASGEEIATEFIPHRLHIIYTSPDEVERKIKSSPDGIIDWTKWMNIAAIEDWDGDAEQRMVDMKTATRTDGKGVFSRRWGKYFPQSKILADGKSVGYFVMNAAQQVWFIQKKRFETASAITKTEAYCFSTEAEAIAIIDHLEADDLLN